MKTPHEQTTNGSSEHISIRSKIIIHDESATTIMLTINDVIEIELTPNVVKKLAEQLDTTSSVATFLERHRLMQISRGHHPEDAGLLTRELLKYMGGLNENSQATGERTTLPPGNNIP